MALSEFDLIARYFERPALQSSSASGVALGIGDDCALLEVPAGQQLAVSMDTSVADVHFPASADPYRVGWRALAVNISDLAAMGAQPAWFTLGLTLPEADERWLEAFSQGLADLAERHGIALVGGDTTRGPLSITIQVHGLVPRGQGLRRDGATPGDRIYVTGTLGDAGGGLQLALGQRQADDAIAQPLLRQYLQPQPQVEAGLVLRGLASAAIDISDGVLADLGHILKRSRAGAELIWERLPLSQELQSLLGEQQARELALTAGDDYQLCFTVSPAREDELKARLAALSIPATCIGVVRADAGLHWQGGSPSAAVAGYTHF